MSRIMRMLLTFAAGNCVSSSILTLMRISPEPRKRWPALVQVLSNAIIWFEIGNGLKVQKKGPHPAPGHWMSAFFYLGG